MKLPSPKELGAALRYWRKRYVDKTLEELGNEKILSKHQLGRIERGKRVTYEELVDRVLPLYKIDDFDIFIDKALNEPLDDAAKMKSIAIIKDFSIDKRGEAVGVEMKIAPKGSLKSNRTRIDVLSFKPGECTTRRAHHGHEYVYVPDEPISEQPEAKEKRPKTEKKAVLCCHFSVGKQDEKVKLHRGEAVAFSSHISHRLKNISGEAIEVYVARPTHSPPHKDLDP